LDPRVTFKNSITRTHATGETSWDGLRNVWQWQSWARMVKWSSFYMGRIRFMLNSEDPKKHLEIPGCACLVSLEH